jgi:hypothetical protein
MRLRLLDLEPEWVRDSELPDGAHRRDQALTIATAQGVLFLNPVEFVKNGGAVGTSSVLVWFRGRSVPDGKEPGPGRWDVSGTDFADLTLSPSVDLTCGGKRPCDWHGWIKNGEVT